MRAAAVEFGLSKPELSRVKRLGRGLSRTAFTAEVEPTGDVEVDGWPRDLVALVPRDPSADFENRNAEREARLLTFLAARELGFRTPRFATCVTDGDDEILVCEYVGGIPADLRAGRMSWIVPWELVARVAATIHRIPLQDLAWLPGHATRREHGEEVLGELASLADAPAPEARAALSWLRANLPPAEPARLVHGDLLGQNLLVFPDEAPAVLDWEHAVRGDPALDLAVVTRGVRHPFQTPGGMQKLLDAYAERADGEVREEHVRFHEMVMHLNWYGAALAGTPDVEPAASVLARLRNLVARVGG